MSDGRDEIKRRVDEMERNIGELYANFVDVEESMERLKANIEALMEIHELLGLLVDRST